MLVFSNSKINIGLNILQKRIDHYHNIQSVFYPIDFDDVLDIIPSNKFIYTNTGIKVDCALKHNLCFRAFDLLQKDFPRIKGLEIYHHKLVPAKMGLGGGSANGVIVLKTINELYNLQLSPNELEQYAIKLGSDCVFFCYESPAIVKGTGTDIKPIKLNLSSFQLLLILPNNILVSTDWAYNQIIPTNQIQNIDLIINKPIETWKNNLSNDFETAVFKVHPELQNIKNELYKQGAIYASLTGTGAAVYGIFRKTDDLHYLDNKVLTDNTQQRIIPLK